MAATSKPARSPGPHGADAPAEPRTVAGRALAGWFSRSRSLAESIARVEREARAGHVDLGSPEFHARLVAALRATRTERDGIDDDHAARLIVAALISPGEAR